MAGIMLCNTFTRLDHVISDKSVGLAGKIWNNKWKSIKLIPELECPILILTGLKDKTVPPNHSALLYDAAKKSTLRRKVRIIAE